MSSIREVAEKAGVSTATVSRLINDNGFVSAEARQKIQQAFKETGYDPAKRKRRTPQNGTSGLKHKNVVMIWNTGLQSERSMTGQNMMVGITQTLQEMDASLTVAHLLENNEIPPALFKTQIDGILIHGPAPSPTICKQIKNIPVVWLLQQGSSDFGDRVQPDHEEAGKLAFQHLVDHGCRHLCCMSYTPTMRRHANYWKSRETSFLGLAAETRTNTTLLTCPELFEPAASPAVQADAAKKLVADLLETTPRPDGLYVTTALGPYIHQELTKNGIIPMKDILMVAGDANICDKHHLIPEPVTTRLFSDQIGKQAVEILLLRIKNPDMPQITCMLKPELVIPEQA